MAPFVKDMRVDHRGTYVFVAEQLLDGPDVVTGFEQMGGEGMPKGVAADVFDDSSFADGFLYCPLEDRFVNVVSPFLPRLRVFPTVLLWEDPLPAPFWRARSGIYGRGHLADRRAPSLLRGLFRGSRGFLLGVSEGLASATRAAC